MTVAANVGFGVHLAGFFLEAANKHHLVIVVEKRFAVFSPRYRGRGLLIDRSRIMRTRLLFAFRFQDVPDPFLSRASATKSSEAQTF